MFAKIAGEAHRPRPLHPQCADRDRQLRRRRRSLPQAERLLADASPLVRGAAVWALGRLDPARLVALAPAHAGEPDAGVAEEWAACGPERDRLPRNKERRREKRHGRTHAPHCARRIVRRRHPPPRARLRGLARAQHFPDPRPDRRRRRRRQRPRDRRRPVAKARPADRGRAEARRGRHACRGADGARHTGRLFARLDSERPRRHGRDLQDRCPTIRSTTSPSSARRSNSRS